MSIKEDVLRALEYGREPYYEAIKEVPSYQAELSRVRSDYNESTWIDFKGFWPKFTTEEFEKRRDAYQARYGNTINIPGFADVIHIIPQARISTEERAAHVWAIQRGLPSPLTPAQQATLKYKKFRFIKALAAATPAWMRTYGSVATALDNVEDALVTVVVLGRIAVKIAPRLLGRIVPGLGWVLLGSDILNAANLISWASFASMGAKRSIESLAERNPFHAKAAARRTLKLDRAIPTFGEILEILQTTEQLWGIGLCLGGLMGMVEDTAAKAFSQDYWTRLTHILVSGNVNEISNFIAQAAANDADSIKKQLQNQWTLFKDPAYRLKDWDQAIRNAVYNWAQKERDKLWGWVKSIPPEALDPFGAGLIGTMIISTGQDDFTKEDHTKAYIMSNTAVQGLMDWWIKNDPLTNFKELRNMKWRAPQPADPTTQQILDETTPEWKTAIKWPHLDLEFATIEQIALNYAPKIKESFQVYALNNAHEYDAMVAAQQIVEATKNIIRAYADDNNSLVGMTAWWAVGESMLRDIYIIPPDTSETQIANIADYVRDYERAHAAPPSMQEVAYYGESIGIEWMRTFPRRAFIQAAEIFPEWEQIQGQFEDLYIPNL